jgi:hypothetical protein
VCEAALLPGRGNRRRTCKRSKCKAEFRLRPVLYLPFPGAKTCTSYPLRRPSSDPSKRQ